MTSAEPLTVLVVDDDFRVAGVHVGFVEAVPGFRVVGTAHTAADALELARPLRPDLVLMDVYLPDGDGLRWCATCWSTRAARCPDDLGRERPRHRAARGAAGALHYLVKPFGFAELAERLAAFRNARTHIAGWPAVATQEDVDRIFDLLRPDGPPRPTRSGAPRPDAAASSTTLSPGACEHLGLDVAAAVGISRATAQRWLTQLEQSGAVRLELRYGTTGRPEHRYSVKRR